MSLPASIDGEKFEVNTTGQTTVAGLVSMAELIANNSSTIPPLIYRLLRSVIRARSAMYMQFEHLVAKSPDAELQKSNESHKFFIDALERSFDILGGQGWIAQQGSEKGKDKDTGDDSDNEIQQVIFSNKFSTLSADQGEESKDESDNTEPQTSVSCRPLRKAQRKKRKGKNGKGKKPKTKPPTQKEANLDNVPLEGYKIIQNDEGLGTDYFMALLVIAQEWSDLRSYLRDVWRDVAYDGGNSAVAGAVSTLAIHALKRTSTAIFIEFPGKDAYATVIEAISCGDLDKLEHAGGGETLMESDIDVKEFLLVDMYSALLDFITYFQKNRTGKPTKAMQAELRDWNPTFDLQDATQEQRLKWRWAYIINWLYDLVNLFSHVVVQANMNGEGHVYEQVDWSPQGPWNGHRRLFGLNEFAGFVASLAMQKPGTEIRYKILPYHVFQLQCIVDSLTISRGWSFAHMGGHILTAPANTFRPTRDIDIFLGRDDKGTLETWGYLNSADMLQKIFLLDGGRSGNFESHKRAFTLIEDLQRDFADWLGQSKYMHGLTGIPPSLFSNSNANGLWEYSPFLCGVGLMEGLELAYRVSMMVWDGMDELMLLVHLHNMLLQKGHLSSELSLCNIPHQIMPEAFFAGGKTPTSNFADGLFARVQEARRSSAPKPAQSLASTDDHVRKDLERCLYFRRKSNLLLYREASWDPEGIPDSEIQVYSFLGFARIGQTKTTIDPVTGRKRMVDTDLVRRARAIGIDDEEMMELSSDQEAQINPKTPTSPVSSASIVAPGFINTPLTREAASKVDKLMKFMWELKATMEPGTPIPPASSMTSSNLQNPIFTREAAQWLSGMETVSELRSAVDPKIQTPSASVVVASAIADLSQDSDLARNLEKMVELVSDIEAAIEPGSPISPRPSPSVLDTTFTDILSQISGTARKLKNLTGEIKYTNDQRNDMDLNSTDMIKMMHHDIYKDIVGSAPFSNLNYIWAAVEFLMLFVSIESDLKEAQNPTYMSVYKPGGVSRKNKRFELISVAMRGKDEECLRIMARAFDNARGLCRWHLYWEELDPGMTRMPKWHDSKESDETSTTMGAHV